MSRWHWLLIIWLAGIAITFVTIVWRNVADAGLPAFQGMEWRSVALIVVAWPIALLAALFGG